MGNILSVARWRDLLLCLGLLALWVARPIGVDAPAALATPFDTDRAITRLKLILGDEQPHPTGSDANDAVRNRLLGQIRQAGFTPEVRDRFHCNTVREGAAICAQPRNVLFWVTPPGDDAVMLTAHYDSVAAGPGAADDGMGVAVVLEVAHLLKGQPLQRPVLVLITDAEEAGLIGAAAFAAQDPIAKRVGAVINLEARGTTGQASMFQTSSPNGHDIAALRKGGFVPSANALATNLYELLPNDSDLTMLLPLGVDAANYAIIGAGKRYHTALDNLAHLDRRSVGHMGASALSAVQGFAAAPLQGAEGQSVFTNIEQVVLLVLPRAVAVLCIALGLVAAVVLYVRAGGAKPLRPLWVVPLAVVFGTVAAIAVGALIGLIRPEADFGTAYPAAARLAYGAAALLGVSLILYLARLENRQRIATAAWIWLGGIILALFAFVPGLSVMAVWPLLILLCAAILSILRPWRAAASYGLAIAGLLFLLIALPIAGGIEEALFIEHAAPTGLLLAFAFLFFLPVRGPGFGYVPLACAGLLVAAITAALMAPAYSRDAPRHLTVIHEDADGKGAFLIPDNGPLPAAMATAAAFGTTPDETGHWRAPAPKLADDGRFTLLSDTVAGGVRTIALRIESPSADQQQLQFGQGVAIRQATINGTALSIRGPLTYVGCTGRACRRLDVSLAMAADTPVPEIRWQRSRYGLDPAAKRLISARPDTAQPVHMGDRRSIVRTVTWPPAGG